MPSNESDPNSDDRTPLPSGSIGERQRPWSHGAALVQEDTTDLLDIVDRFTTNEITVDNELAAHLQNPDPSRGHRFQVTTPQSAMGHTLRIIPSRDLIHDQQRQRRSQYRNPGRLIPSQLPRLLQTIKRPSKKWNNHVNTSKPFALELRRPHPTDLQIQLVVPETDMANAARGTLRSELPGTTFSDGVDGLPIAAGDRVAACTVTPGSWDWLPLNSDHERPVLTDLALRLHHHLHPDCRIHIQLLFKPLMGRKHPEKRWQGTARKAISQALGYSSDDGQTGTFDRRIARDIEQKTSQLLYQIAIRMVVSTPDDAVDLGSVLVELATALGVLDNTEVAQWVKPELVETAKDLRRFLRATANRTLGFKSQWARMSSEEAAALLAVPVVDQQNLWRHTEP